MKAFTVLRVVRKISNMVNYLIGELTGSQGEPHFWSEMVVGHLFFITLLDNLRRYPALATLGKKLLPRLTVSIRDKHSGYSRQLVARRLASETGRQDFMANLVSKVKAGEVSQEEMTAHASTLV